jgi:hypothetical protein
MAWESNLDPTTKKAVLEKKVATAQPTFDPNVSANLSNVKQRAAWVPIETQLALAKANASNEAIDAVGKMAAQKTIDTQAEPEKPDQSSFLYKNLKTVSRWLTAGLDFIPETTQGAVAQIFDKNTDIDGWFISTKLGSLIKATQGDYDPVTGERITAGSGFFVSDELLERQGERARRYRGTINGSAFTIGRAAANTVFKPKTLPYNFFSGLVDALVLVKTDPTGPVAKAVKEFKDVTTLIPRLTRVQTDELRKSLEADAGFIPGLSDVGLNETKYAHFMDTNFRARTLVGRLRDEKDVVKIMDMFDQSANVTNEMVALLAKAETDDQVKAVLALGFQLEKGALTDQVRLLQKSGRLVTPLKNFGGNLIERTPLANSKFVKSSSRVVTKYLTEKPEEALIVGGDRFQNSKAAKNIVNYLRTVGADEETVSRIGAQAVESFSETGTRPEQYAVLETFNKAIDETLKLNGVAQKVRDDVFRQVREGLDQVRLYMLDRAGVTTDNGMAQWLANSNRDFLPFEEIETLIKTFGEGGDFRIITPLQISEMLQRVQVLPDVRQLRRLTSNRFFGFGTFAGTKGDLAAIKTKIAELKKQLDNAAPNTPEYAQIKQSLELAKKELDNRSLAVGNFVGGIGGQSDYRDVTKIVDEELYDKLGGDIAYYQQMASTGLGDPDDVAEAIRALQAEREALKQNVSMRVRTGEERAGLKAIDVLQNQIWKPLTLMTGGYVVRNSLDAQVRMAFSGLPSVFTHPFEYISLVLGQSKRTSLKGELLTGLKLEEYVDDVREAMTFGLRQQGLGPEEIFDHMVKTGAWSRATRSDINGEKLHTDAVAQNGYLVHADPLQKIAASTFVEFGGVTSEARLVAKERIVAAIKADKKTFDTLKQAYASGFEIIDTAGTKGRLAPVLFDQVPAEEVDQLLFQHAERIVVNNVQELTGNIPDIEFAYAFNRIPLRDAKGNLAPVLRQTMSDVIPFEVTQIRVGSTVVTSSDPNNPTFGVITKLVNEKTGERFIESKILNPDDFIAEIQPIVAEKAGKEASTFATAFGPNGVGTPQFREIVKNTQLWDGQKGLPEVLKREILATERNTSTWRKSLDRPTNWFFGQLYGSVTRKLERSPVFRKYYYEEVGKYVDELSPEGAQDALNAIKEAAKEAGESVEKYVGSPKLLKDLNRASTGKGTATLQELDDYAKHVGLEKTKGLLYDASNKTNLEDIMRIIAPFAPAWREIIGTYSHILREDPVSLYRNTTRIYNAASNADPDNDGRGFFYNDPVTNAMTFMFPASGALAKAITGFDAPLKAPLQRLSQGLQVFPALGPFAQLAASKLIPDTPKTDKIVEVLLPYGRKDIRATGGAIVPGYAQKLLQALTRDEGKMDTVYANTYVETLRALSATGKYDMGNPDEIKKLQSDAKGKAQWLTAFRALSQFLGPTAGATEFKITTKDGDIFVSELIKQFYALQTKDYDSAVQTFLDQFGDDAGLYISSKSKSTVQGLEATEQFGDWERSNGDLLKEFPDIASYLAPGGDDFSFAVWDRQIRSGKRERLTDKEIIDLAQERIGSAKYRWARKQIGQFPTDDSRALLKRYRAALHAELPGFPLVAEFKVGEYDNQVEDMKLLVTDPRVANSPIAQTINTYLQVRNRAKEVAFQQFGSDNIKQSKQTQYLRDKLASIGEMLILENPEFGRVWQRFLSYEVED